MKKPLISIIIPTYNRAHLIGETLDSVIAQSYSNWECIVVDDGSSDKTADLLENYCKIDNRIKYYQRPQNKVKGANACRNYGLELSKGYYINWFDSDDIMRPNFLEVKLNAFNSHPSKDFIVSRGLNLYEDGTTKALSIRNNKTKKLDHNNFVLFEVFWITHDFLVKKESLKNVRFDEELQSGQDYNFFVKVLSVNILDGFFVDKILFKRRWHKNSIQGQFNGGDDKYCSIGDDNYCLGLYILYKNTFRDTSQYLNEKARKHMFRRIASRAFELKLRKLNTPEINEVFVIYKKEKGWLKTLIFKLSLWLGYNFGKGFKLMDFSRN